MSKIIRIDDLQDGIRGTFLQRLSPEDLKRKLAESYLGVLTNDDTLANPFGNLSPAAQDRVPEYLTWIMSQPEYFYFLIKVIFQMKTYPLQCLILKELYTHKFPILLGARGLSKCVVKDTYIQTSYGIKQISDLGIKDIPDVQQPISESLYGEKTYNKIEYGWYNGKKETRKITSRSGRSIECTLNHPLRVVSNGEIVWKDAEHLKLGDYLVVQRTYKQWENYNSLDKDVAYMIGAIVGDGCYSNKTGVIQFTNMDDDCIENVNKGLYAWAKASLRQGKSQSFQYTVMSDNFRSGELKKKFWGEFEAKPYNGGDDKETPKIIMGAHFDSIAAYLQGLFDTDGCCVTNSPMAQFSTKSKKLADETQLLLLVLGINSNLRRQFNKKYNRCYYKIVISGNSLREFKDKIGFRIKRKQDMLIKHCLRIPNNNIDLVPRELFVDKMLAIRELARDCKISSGHGHNNIRKHVSPVRIKSYDMSIEKFGTALDILSKSESVKKSKEYKDLRDIQAADYIYDKVVKIEKGFEKTYDVHLEGDDHSFITNGFISHNSYSLAMYFLIKMLLTPGIRCVITGAGFRQAKIVFEYMEQIWKKSKMLQSCFPGKKDGPNHGTDVWTFRLGDSTTYALPVGPDGSKIRGFRANCVSGETLIKTAIGEIPISEYLNYGSPAVYNMNCELEYPSHFITTDLTDIYCVKTVSGKSLRFSKIHRLYTPSGWIFGKDLRVGNEIYCYDQNLQIFKDTVKSAYKEDKQEVLFDFTMPKTESFLGGGFVNHNCLVAEEFSSVNRAVFEEVMSGFLSVAASPIEQVEHNACTSTMKKLMIPVSSDIEESNNIIQNQLILSGTAYYKFNHFYQYFHKWREILYTRGDKKKLREILGADQDVENFNWRDYSIIRIPVELIPSGFMDMDQINRTKASSSADVFKREFGVCLHPSTKILTTEGPKRIKDVKIGDKVLTHRGRFRAVNKLTYQKTDHLLEMKFYGNNKNMYVTENHPIYVGRDEFTAAGETKSIVFTTLNGEISYKLKSRKKIKFNGYVYNLEVDDDHSYHTEFGCVHNCFSDDSDGFFKRSLINSCTVNEFIPIIKGREEIKFNPALYGDKTKKYIYGIDPAYQGDNFAIVILEIHETHRRVVHSWTTQASDHKERLKAGVVTENDYYHYCVKKIRSLMKRFPCAYIALDSDGGGKAIVEAFMDVSKLEPGEEMILPVINPEEKPKDTDFMQGDHILHIIKFTSEWITEANHSLKKDMEAKDLIFPYHDSISYVEAEFYDESIVGDSKELYDTLDDCIYDIEELKNELSTITISETATGKERFDTPDIKTGIAKKGRLRKDRYSALLLANWIARTHSVFITRATPQEIMTMGAANNIDPSKCFLGNNKLAKALNDLYA